MKIRHSVFLCSEAFAACLSGRSNLSRGLCDECAKEEMPDMKTNNGLAESRAQEIPPLKVIVTVLPRSRSRGGRGGWGGVGCLVSSAEHVSDCPPAT